MKQQNIILLLGIVAVALIISLTASVGYATVTDFTNDQTLRTPGGTEFKVEFNGNAQHRGTGTAKTRITGPTTATMNIEGLKSVGDYVTVSFEIKNYSRDIDAALSKTVVNTNKEYFRVTSTLSNSNIPARNGKAILSVKVELIKLPIKNVETTNICVKVVASPKY